MYQLSVAVLLISSCIELACCHNNIHSSTSNLLLNANRLAAESLDWGAPISSRGDQSTVLNFDDIPTTDGKASIGSYNGLLFEGLTVVDASSIILDDEDRDCATSHPNALVSLSSPDGQSPQIRIGAAQPGDGISSLIFDLESLSIKPRLNRSSDPVLIRYKFWQVRNGEEVAANVSQVFHGVGHHPVTNMEFKKYGFTIRDLTAFEITVVEDSKVDLAFCLDNLGVRIHSMTDREMSE